MTATARKPILLPPEQADYIDRLVESGAFATAADVVDAGLKALQAQDTRLEHWLREAVAPAYDAMQAEPSRAISLDDAFADIRARHEKRLMTGS
jgi:antitoxin ParD1/3/4